MLPEMKADQCFMGRLSHGDDLLEALNKVCQEHHICLGSVAAIGAVQKAVLGYYDQTARVYKMIALDRPMEIVHLTGNVSIKDDRPFVHAHVTFSDGDGRTFGGHLFPGTVIFACEVILYSFRGPVLRRAMDATTGLPLWNVTVQ